MRWLRHPLAFSAVVFLAALAAGCAGTAPPAGEETAQPPASEGPAAGGAVSDSTFHVTLYTDLGQMDIDDFTVETSNRKFLRRFHGFRPRDLKTMTSIPFEGIYEVQFNGLVPESDFNVLLIGKERMGLRNDEMFDMRIRYPDGTVVDFYAIITKLRGYRDVQPWEQPLTGNNFGLRRIEFR